MTAPLDDVRVIEMGQLLAGPFCGQLLGDFGAECTHFGLGVVLNDAVPQRGWPCCGSFFSSRQTWRSWCS